MFNSAEMNNLTQFVVYIIVIIKNGLKTRQTSKRL